jgi:hypothetical protein
VWSANAPPDDNALRLARLGYIPFFDPFPVRSWIGCTYRFLVWSSVRKILSLKDLLVRYSRIRGYGSESQSPDVPVGLHAAHLVSLEPSSCGTQGQTSQWDRGNVKFSSRSKPRALSHPRIDVFAAQQASSRGPLEYCDKKIADSGCCRRPKFENR